MQATSCKMLLGLDIFPSIMLHGKGEKECRLLRHNPTLVIVPANTQVPGQKLPVPKVTHQIPCLTSPNCFGGFSSYSSNLKGNCNRVEERRMVFSSSTLLLSSTSLLFHPQFLFEPEGVGGSGGGRPGVQLIHLAQLVSQKDQP